MGLAAVNEISVNLLVVFGEQRRIQGSAHGGVGLSKKTLRSSPNPYEMHAFAKRS